jgi:hypothetical protein
LRLTNLVTTDAVAEVLPPRESNANAAVANVEVKHQDRLVSETVGVEKPLPAPKSTKTAQATAPTGGVAVASPVPPQR